MSNPAKKTLPDTNMRRAYYEVSDKLPALKKQAELLQDKELFNLVKEIENKLKKVYQKLDEKYFWD